MKFQPVRSVRLSYTFLHRLIANTFKPLSWLNSHHIFNTDAHVLGRHQQKVKNDSSNAILEAYGEEGKLKDKRSELQRALKGLMGSHQRAILATMLRHIDYLKEEIERLDGDVKERLQPHQEQVAKLDAIAGVGERSAQTIIAEIGVDMSVFPTANHLASWAGMCPGNNETGGKKKR